MDFSPKCYLVFRRYKLCQNWSDFSKWGICGKMYPCRLPTLDTLTRHWTSFRPPEKIDLTLSSRNRFTFLLCSHGTVEPSWNLTSVCDFTSYLCACQRVQILDGYRVHIVPVKFAVQNFRRSWCSHCNGQILDRTGLNFDLYFRRSIFRTVSLVPFEQKPQTHEFSTGQNLSVYTTYWPRVRSLQGNLSPRPWCAD